MELLRHTQTHTGQLFMLYNDPAGRVDALLDAAARAKPDVEIRDEYDVVHRLWPVTDAQTIETIHRELADKKLVIADGHHRYETALAYRDERRARAGRVDPNAPYEKVMMTLFNTAGKGLTILPTHRVGANVPEFSLDGYSRSSGDMLRVAVVSVQRRCGSRRSVRNSFAAICSAGRRNGRSALTPAMARSTIFVSEEGSESRSALARRSPRRSGSWTSFCCTGSFSNAD